MSRVQIIVPAVAARDPRDVLSLPGNVDHRTLALLASRSPGAEGQDLRAQRKGYAEDTTRNASVFLLMSRIICEETLYIRFTGFCSDK